MTLKFLQQNRKGFVYQGEIFREGTFAERGITVTSEDIDFIAQTTIPGIPLKLEHSDTALDGALDGYGIIELIAKTSDDGKRYLWASVLVPEWLHEALGGEFKVSVGFLPAIVQGARPALGELSVVGNPRVTSARLKLAYQQFAAQFAGARHNSKDKKALRTILSALRDLGLDPDDLDEQEEGDYTTSAGQPLVKEKQPRMSIKEKLTKFFGATPKALADAGITQEEFNAEFGASAPPAQAVPPAAPTTPSDSNDFSAKLAAMDTQMKAANAALVTLAAEAFAKDVVYTQRKAPVAKLDELKGLYADALSADAAVSGTSCFDANGKAVEGTQVKNLKKVIEGWPSTAHHYGNDQVPGRDSSKDGNAPKFNASAAVNAYNRGGN